NYKDAVNHFTNVYYSPDCPSDLRIQSALATGDALMSRSAADGAGRRGDLLEALGWFQSVPEQYPTNAAVPLAWGLVGNCQLQLAGNEPSRYLEASNAYQKMLTFTNVSPAVHYQAKLGLATVAETLGRQKTGDEQSRLFNVALNHYLDIIGDNLYSDADRRDLFSVKEAGLKAGRVAETLKQWPQAVSIYSNLQ